eukprot:818853-Pyramimonas_sp.AAC.1
MHRIPPSWRSACIKTWGGGWITESRMRSPYRRCVWGCPGARDSLKHYFCWCDPMYMLVRSQLNADLPAP